MKSKYGGLCTVWRAHRSSTSGAWPQPFISLCQAISASVCSPHLPLFCCFPQSFTGTHRAEAAATQSCLQEAEVGGCNNGTSATTAEVIFVLCSFLLPCFICSSGSPGLQTFVFSFLGLMKRHRVIKVALPHLCHWWKETSKASKRHVHAPHRRWGGQEWEESSKTSFRSKKKKNTTSYCTKEATQVTANMIVPTEQKLIAL